MKSLIAAAVATTLAQPAVLPPTDNLVVEGVPPVPISLVDSVYPYTEFRSASLNSWHPRERKMLIGTRFADTHQTHLVDFPLGERRQLTFFRDNVSGSSFQPTTGQYFVLSKDLGGDEFYQKYRYDMNNAAITLLTDGKSRNTGGAWSTAGDRIVFASNRRNGNDMDLYVMRPEDPQKNRLLARLEGGGWAATDWSPDDKQILVDEEISANESYLWSFDSESGAKTALTPKDAQHKDFYQGGVFSKDGKSVFTITDRGSDFRRLARIDLQSKNITYLDNYSWDVDDFDLSEDGSLIAFTTNEDGKSKLHLLQTSTGRELPKPILPVGQISNPNWHKNSIELGFNLTNSQSPPDVYSWNRKTGEVSRWTQSETGGLDTSSFSEPELIKWPSFDKREISGFLYRPPAKFTGKRPVVINIHGGPEGQFRPGYLGRTNYYLNELGVAMIFPNVRGSTGYGKTFLALDNGFKREDSYKDIGALLDWIKARPDLDSDRIMVTGGSYGGFMTLAVATNYNDRIRCSLDVVGPSNLVTFLEHTQGYRRDLRRVEYGDERDPKMRAFLEGIAPARHADKIKKPIFVVQGQNDPRVPASESEQMVAEVRKTGTPVWFLMARDEGHGFRKKGNGDFQFYATILFMKKYLLD